MPPPTVVAPGPTVVGAPSPGHFRIPTNVEVTEYDPNSQMLTRRKTSFYPGDGQVHVIVEEGVGSLHVVSKHVARAAVDEPIPALVNDMGIICPAGLENQVMDTLLEASANGGQCFRGSFMNAEAAVIADLVATRRFLVRCETNGANPRAAAGDPASAYDPMWPIILVINVPRLTPYVPRATGVRRDSTPR
jgi:hypothetical protein